MKNAQLTEYSGAKCFLIHAFAKLIGVQVKINGIPFGAKRKVTNSRLMSQAAPHG